MTRFDARRRFVLRALAGTLLAGTARAAGDPPRDQGIGGTGVAAAPPSDGDRGIGGTGVIGTIRRFGSIVVNGLRIAYPADATVRIDGRPATIADLRVGHVVGVFATGETGRLSTAVVDVNREVVGPIESIDGKRMRVLGQSVDLGAAKPTFATGDWVAVSGLRRLDGTIVASLVERADAGVARVSGPVSSRSDGVGIAGLDLSAKAAAFAGTRVQVEGRVESGRFTPTAVTPDGIVDRLAGARTVSIEAYASRAGTVLRLGSGLTVEVSTTRRAVEGRAIIVAQRTPDGALRIERATPVSAPRFDPTRKEGPPAGRNAPQAPRASPAGGKGGDLPRAMPGSPGRTGGGGRSGDLPLPSRVGPNAPSSGGGALGTRPSTGAPFGAGQSGAPFGSGGPSPSGFGGQPGGSGFGPGGDFGAPGRPDGAGGFGGGGFPGGGFGRGR